MRPAKYQECFICHKMLDDEGKPADEYAVHGRGSGKVVNYFHRSCFHNMVKEAKRGGPFDDSDIQKKRM